MPKDLDYDSESEESVEAEESSDHEDGTGVIIPQYSDEEDNVQIGDLDI